MDNCGPLKDLWTTDSTEERLEELDPFLEKIVKLLARIKIVEQQFMITGMPRNLEKFPKSRGQLHDLLHLTLNHNAVHRSDQCVLEIETRKKLVIYF